MINPQQPQLGGSSHNSVASLDSPASSVEVPLMKHLNSIVIDSVSGGEPCKKPHLEGCPENHEESATIQMKGQLNMAEEGADVTKEGNGLMSLEDCISAVFEEDEEKEEEYTCNLCA